MEDIQAGLDAEGDGRRHWHGVYRRGTVAVRNEIERGGFLDAGDVLVVRVGSEDREIAAAERPGDRSLADRLLVPMNRAGSKRFLKEARRKVYDNARLLSLARRRGPEALAARLSQLEELCRLRVADLRAPGQVLLKLTLRGFGVVLPDDPTSPVGGGS
jgi:hypothetical protein